MSVRPVRTVFFLSDFGTQDEFAGVVHAVIAARAPDATVIDLTHEIPPFDVRAGSHTLVRAVPYLGSGVVLAVVDPGVGTSRRAVALEAWRDDDEPPLYFVGPDNGLLVAAAEAAGPGGGGGAPVARAVELRAAPSPPAAEPTVRGRTFDGRDVFAPAAAALCAGDSLASLGEAVEPASLVRLIAGVVDIGRLRDGRTCLRAEVTWVDRYGNLQLAATESDARAAGLPTAGVVELVSLAPGPDLPPALAAALVPDGMHLQRVDAFSGLGSGDLGLLVDANGHLAVVARESSAATWLNVGAGELVVLAW